MLQHTVCVTVATLVKLCVELSLAKGQLPENKLILKVMCSSWVGQSTQSGWEGRKGRRFLSRRSRRFLIFINNLLVVVLVVLVVVVVEVVVAAAVVEMAVWFSGNIQGRKMFFCGEVRHCSMKKQIWSLVKRHHNTALGQINSPWQPDWQEAMQKYSVNYTFSVNLLPAICDKAWEWWGESS